MEPPAPHDRGLFALFVDRPVLTAMATLALVVIGVIAFTRLPLRFVPDGMTQNQISIWVPVRQSRTPQEIEDKIVEPLEELLRTIPGVQEIKSEAHEDSAVLRLRLDEGLDPALAAAEVRDRAQRAKLQWPADVERYFTWREDASSVPLAFFQMLTPQRSSQWDFLIDKVVRPRLEAVDGVGRVDVWGLLDETLRIRFDRDKLVAHRVDYGALMRRLAGDNFARPVGELDDGDQRYLARVDCKFGHVRDIAGYPVRPGLVLSDLATVERVPSVRDQLSRYNQKYTYTGWIRATAGTNPVDASGNLHRALDELRTDPRLADMEFRFLFDQGGMITDSLQTLLSTSLQGGALALIVLFLFLRRTRYTLAIAMSIPLTLTVVGAWLFFTGDSLNILTMAGMTLAVGMVVDNSVVVLENIRRLRDDGASVRSACVHGAREVALAVSLATLTTVVVILPMVFIGNGQARVMLGAVGIPLSVALIASLGTALLLLPSGVRHLGGSGENRETRLDRLAAKLAWLSPVSALMKFNHGLLRAALRHRVVASLLALGCLATCQMPWKSMDFRASNGGIFRRGDVSLHMEMPRGLDLGDVEAAVIDYENFVLAHRDEWHVDSVSSRFSRRDASIDIALASDFPRSEFDGLRHRIEKAWPRRAGVKVRLEDSSQSQGGAGGTGNGDERTFSVQVYGRDTDYLLRLAQDVRDRIASMPEVDKVEIPQLEDNREVTVRVRRSRMNELGVQPEVLQGSVVAGLQGQQLTRFEEQGRETPVIAEFDRDRNPSLLDLETTHVFARGAVQDLTSVADVGFEPALGTISRIDGRTNVTLVGRRAEGTGPAAMSRALQHALGSLTLPRGYSWSEDSAFLDTKQQMADLMDALLLGVVLVFLLMGVLFESVILPLSIMFTVPFALFGATWSLWLWIGELDPMAVVGMILLAGIVVNNGIVLLDCIARLRGEMSREQAILEGTRRRLRPILMTATTTIAGLLPMALFGRSDGQGLSYVSMSVAVGGGLLFCTVFTAFVVPLAYTFMDDLEGWWWRVWRRAMPRAAAGSVERVG